jgi:DNA-binding NarL/FixJ family response regulator
MAAPQGEVDAHGGDGGLVVVAVVDECPATALGVALWLDCVPQTRVVVASRDELDAPHRRLAPTTAVLVMELMYQGRARLPDIRRLARAGHTVVVYTRSCDRVTSAAVARAGARSCVSTIDGRGELVRVVAALVAAHGRQEAESADAAPDRPSLSVREADATVLWLRSPSKHVVARLMRISPHTVDMYLRRVRRKYEQAGRPAHTKAELLTRAIEDGLVTVDTALG